MAMKLVSAIIQPNKLDEVRDALTKAEIFRITVSRCTGRGRDHETDLYRGAEVVPELLPKVRIDIACSDEAWAQKAIDTIVLAARHNGGEIGDGKVFVTPLEQCIRIRTGEDGSDAI